MKINTNVSALNPQRNIKNVGKKQARALIRLSSGLKINNAADDAAGFSISEKMKAQIRGLEQNERNVQDGISLIQTAEGSMVEISDMVNRQRELIIQSLNDTYTNSDRDKIQMEIDQLTAEIDSITERTEFNEISLLSIPNDSTGGEPSSPLISLATEIGLFGTIEYSESHVDFIGQQTPPGISDVGTIQINAGEVLVVNSLGNPNIELTVTKTDGTSVLAPVNNLSSIQQPLTKYLMLVFFHLSGRV